MEWTTLMQNNNLKSPCHYSYMFILNNSDNLRLADQMENIKLYM